MQDAATWDDLSNFHICWADNVQAATHVRWPAGCSAAAAARSAGAAAHLLARMHLLATANRPGRLHAFAPTPSPQWCSYACFLSSFASGSAGGDQCWLSKQPDGAPGSQCWNFPENGGLSNRSNSAAAGSDGAGGDAWQPTPAPSSAPVAAPLNAASSAPPSILLLLLAMTAAVQLAVPWPQAAAQAPGKPSSQQHLDRDATRERLHLLEVRAGGAGRPGH